MGSDHGVPFQPYLLVVDDEQIVRDLFGELLTERGVRFLAVENAEQALTALAEHAFDLVIADKNLPGQMSGLDLIALIKAKNPDLDVILITAYSDAATAIEAIRHGVYDYIVKPFDSQEDVWRRLDRALEKRRLRLDNLQLLEQLRTTNQELENKVAERTRQLEVLTLSDDVTGLHNQRFLFQRLPEECKRARRYVHPLAVLMIDVDHFKSVNDSHDHVFGSQALRQLGEVMQQCVRGIDLCVRYGGDEYCIVLPETDLISATVVAERLRQQVAMRDVSNLSEPYYLTVSIGVTEFGESGAAEAQALLQAADRALYAAKAKGRNCVMVHAGGTICSAQEVSGARMPLPQEKSGEGAATRQP